MPLSWKEIKDHAIRLSEKWKNETSEFAEAKPSGMSFATRLGSTEERWPPLISR